jgi:Na+:H+ antiporter, NhaA family
MGAALSIRPIAMIADFLRLEAASGIFLAASAMFALALANSPLAGFYAEIQTFPVALEAGDFAISKTLLIWVNEGLMALFFFLVGLEVKREFMAGELSSFAKAALPVLAALGGMIVPAIIYVALNAHDAVALQGWAIPTATDIAFALSVMALLGSHVPLSLKILLTAIAVIDDIGAILVIAVFYTDHLSLVSLGVAAVGTMGLAALNLAGVTRTAPYVLIGFICWAATLNSGVHATGAGVVAALAIPFRARREDGQTPLEYCEHSLHPWVAYGVLPIFGFLNAGVPLAESRLSVLGEGVTLGVALALFVGKPLGVMLAIVGGVRLAGLPMPEDARWTQILGMAALTGIGFTMSLFIGELAFEGQNFETEVRLGVLGASVLSALVGYAFLSLRAPAHASTRETGGKSQDG